MITGTKEAGSEVPGVTWFINLPGFKRADGPKVFRASVVMRPADGTTDRTQSVRVTFHRKVWVTNISDDNEGNAFIQEYIDDPELYQEFFDLLSKSVFLEGQDL